MENRKGVLIDIITVILCIGTVYFAVWAFTGMWPWLHNSYNSYALQAESWLQGRLDLGMDYQHLELAVYSGKFYVSFPPFPSFVMLPFVVLFGTKTPDGFIAFFTAVIGAVYTLKLLEAFGKKGASAMFWTLFLIVGSNLLFVQVNGWVWFIAQNMSFTLSIMSIYYAVKNKGGLSLLLWAFSVGCRPFQAVYVIVLLYILYKNHKQENPSGHLAEIIKKRWLWALPPIFTAIVYMCLNYLRFDNPLEFGHNYLPEFVQSEHGQFGIVYLRDNLPRLFVLPEIGENGRLEFPKFNGVAFWLVSPIFISYAVYFIYSLKKKNIDKVLMVLIPSLTILHFIFTCSHKTMGGWHFGNRYINDVLPFLFYGLVNFFYNQNSRLEQLQYPFFMLGLSVNILGTVLLYAGYV